jgi:hypothetical protein
MRSADVAASSSLKKGGKADDDDDPLSWPARPNSITWLTPDLDPPKKDSMHERRTDSARSGGKRREGSKKSPGIGGADRREMAHEFSGLASAKVRVPCCSSLGGAGGDSWGSSNNESGLDSPSLKVSASTVVSRK